MIKSQLFILCAFLFFNWSVELYPHNELNNQPENPGEITLKVLTYMCDHLTGPIALKVYIDGGTPDYTLNAGELLTGQLTVNEFVILGLKGGEGTFVTVTDALGNSKEFWAAAHLMPTPGAEAGPNKTISCLDSLAVLSGSSDTVTVHYNWSGPDTDFDSTVSHPRVDTPGMYYLTVTNTGNGCRSHDSTEVFPAEYPKFDFSYKSLKCHGDFSGSIVFGSASLGSPPYYFSIDGGSSFQNDPIFNHLPAGSYTLFLEDQLKCYADTVVELTQPDPEYLDILSPIVMSYADAHQVQVETSLEPEEILAILWTPLEGLSCFTCLEPVATPENSTVYQLDLTDNKGCHVKDELSITVEKDLNVYIPNVFSPNGDGVNDVFFIKGANGVVGVKLLEIYNRWGNLIYSTNNNPPNDPAFGWDGLDNGRYLSPDVFIYITTIELANGKEVILWGDVTLIR